jgi:hypothetical protein
VRLRYGLVLVSFLLGCLLASCGGGATSKPLASGTVDVQLTYIGSTFMGDPGNLWLIPQDGPRIAVSVPADGATSVSAPPGTTRSLTGVIGK